MKRRRSGNQPEPKFAVHLDRRRVACAHDVPGSRRSLPDPFHTPAGQQAPNASSATGRKHRQPTQVVTRRRRPVRVVPMVGLAPTHQLLAALRDEQQSSVVISGGEVRTWVSGGSSGVDVQFHDDRHVVTDGFADDDLWRGRPCLPAGSGAIVVHHVRPAPKIPAGSWGAGQDATPWPAPPCLRSCHLPRRHATGNPPPAERRLREPGWTPCSSLGGQVCGEVQLATGQLPGEGAQGTLDGLNWFQFLTPSLTHALSTE